MTFCYITLFSSLGVIFTVEILKILEGSRSFMTWWNCFCVLHVKDQTAGNTSSIVGASQINGRHICIFISCIKLGVPKIASKIVVYRPPINIPEFREAKAIFS